jgi:imidazole glycerol-phosphate synthase subunit HisH
MSQNIKVGVINSGIANIASVVNMLKKIGYQALIINSKIEYTTEITHLIIPGVGSFDRGVKNLKQNIFDEIIYKHIELEKPILGICLGMQLLGISSKEGKREGLKIINGECSKFELPKNFTVPHMGWNYVFPKEDSILFRNITNPKFYFVHSYYFPKNTEGQSSFCNYNIDFCSSFEKDNIYGVQFHPEKSHHFGYLLLKNFIELS